MRYVLVLLLTVLAMTSAHALQIDLISTDPAPAVAGEYIDVTVRATNLATQTAVQDVQLGVEDSRYITVLTQPRSYARIQPQDQVTTTFRVYIAQDTPEGLVNLFTRTQTSRGTATTEHEFFVRGAEQAADLRVGRVTSTPQQLLPDSNRNELQITLQNLGERAAELITTELVIPQGASSSYAYSLQDSLASLEGGAQAPLTFTFDINTEQREPIHAELDITYRTRRGGVLAPHVLKETLPITIPVDQAPHLEVVAQELRTSSRQGTSDNRLRVTIHNSGEEEATDVRVRLFPDVSHPFIFERTSQYVGARVEPGQNASLDILYEVLSDATVREHEIRVGLESIVGTSRYTQDDTITIEVFEGSAWGLQRIAGGLIITIIILAATIGIVKRRNPQVKKKS